MEKPIDILIFGGQSNMQGQTEGLPAANEAVPDAWEYRHLSDSLVPLKHPVGECIDGGLLFGADQGHGSLVPAFCGAYCRITGHRAVAIHAARGATAVSQWLPGTERYAAALAKLRGGIRKATELGSVGRIFYIWLQGESDAIARTSTESYIRMLTAYKNALKEDAGIDRFCIIEVGYFCGTVTWIRDRTREEGIACDEAIMAAQEQLPALDPDFVLLTDICKRLSLDPCSINPHAQGHYNNAAMTVIGTQAGTALAQLPVSNI